MLDQCPSRAGRSNFLGNVAWLFSPPVFAWKVALLALVVLFAFAAPAMANSVAPFVIGIPGIFPSMLWYSLPGSILAGVLERPYVVRAGIQRGAFWYCMQANFVSLLVGLLISPFATELIYQNGPTWAFPMILVSILVEGSYLRRIARVQRFTFRWPWLVFSNIVSSSLLFCLPLAAVELNRQWPELYWTHLRYHENLVMILPLSISFVFFVYCFFMPRMQCEVIVDHSDVDPAPSG